MRVDVNGSSKEDEANTVATMIAWRKGSSVHACYFVSLRAIRVMYDSINTRTATFFTRLEFIARTGISHFDWLAF